MTLLHCSRRLLPLLWTFYQIRKNNRALTCRYFYTLIVGTLVLCLTSLPGLERYFRRNCFYLEIMKFVNRINAGREFCLQGCLSILVIPLPDIMHIQKKNVILSFFVLLFVIFFVFFPVLGDSIVYTFTIVAKSTFFFLPNVKQFAHATCMEHLVVQKKKYSNLATRKASCF